MDQDTFVTFKLGGSLTPWHQLLNTESRIRGDGQFVRTVTILVLKGTQKTETSIYFPTNIFECNFCEIKVE